MADPAPVITLSRRCAVCGKPVRRDHPQRSVHAACGVQPPEPPDDGGTPGAVPMAA